MRRFEWHRQLRPKRSICCCLLVSLCLPGFGTIQALADSQVSSLRVNEIAAWLPRQPAGFGWPLADRINWGRLASNHAFSNVIADAQGLLTRPLRDQPDDLYLDYSRTGNRDRWQNVAFERRGRVARLALAEAFENRGRFLPLLEMTIAALCAERTWVYPAHDPALNNFYGRENFPDLGAVYVAMELAEADFVLQERLPQETRRLIRDNVTRRVLRPFRAMVEGRQPEASWMRARHNWNAVCLGSITAAALALEPEAQDRAFYIAAAERYIPYFLEGFPADGYCSEGVGYWNYGFGHFIVVTEAARQATGGKVDFMSGPAATQPALFCVRSEIINGVYPTISDVHPGTTPDPQLTAYVRRRFELNSPNRADEPLAGMNRGLAMTLMLSSLGESLPIAHHVGSAGKGPLRSWFPDGGVLLCRTAPGDQPAFGAALKGGNNAENHNHNDVGSFSVVSGRSMVICDPGAEVYTARTFGPHRYDSKVLNSFGHAVPVVAAQRQKTGADARALVLKTDFTEAEDTLVLDIHSAYPVKGLQKLERTFVFRRGAAPSLEVRDDVSSDRPRTFESALIIWSEWRLVTKNTLEIRDGRDGVSVRIDTQGRAFQVRAEDIDEDVFTKRKPVRIGIALESAVTNAIVVLRMEPLRRHPAKEASRRE